MRPQAQRPASELARVLALESWWVPLVRMDLQNKFAVDLLDVVVGGICTRAYNGTRRGNALALAAYFSRPLLAPSVTLGCPAHLASPHHPRGMNRIVGSPGLRRTLIRFIPSSPITRSTPQAKGRLPQAILLDQTEPTPNVHAARIGGYVRKCTLCDSKNLIGILARVHGAAAQQLKGHRAAKAQE